MTDGLIWCIPASSLFREKQLETRDRLLACLWGVIASRRAQRLPISRMSVSQRDAIRPVLRAITAGITIKG